MPNGSAAPLLHLKRESTPISGTSIRSLVELLMTIERMYSAGPWDDWDGVALSQCREIVRRRLNEAYDAVDEQLKDGSDA
jgi:hypothetical protein